MSELNRSVYGRGAAGHVLRTRSYSASDSANVEEGLQLSGQRSRQRRFSLTELLLGQRSSLYITNEPVIAQTVKEVSDSMENLAEEPTIMSAESNSEWQNEALSQRDGNETNEKSKVSHTDQQKSPLLDTVLFHLSSITGVGAPVTVSKGSDEQVNSGEYNTVYSDDLLMDRMYRRMNSRNKEKH